MFADNREEIYETYCKELRHVEYYYPWLSDSARRRQAIANLTSDFEKVLGDFMKALQEVTAQHAQMDE